MYRLDTAILDWPLSSAATKEVQGPDTTGRRIQGLLFLACWWCMCTICIFWPLLRTRWLEGLVGTPSPPFKPIWAEPPPSPLGYIPYPAPCKRWRRGQPRRNRTSASDSRSEAADLARGGRGDHFGLFGASVRGQGAELEASAGWPARFFLVLLYIISGKPGRAGTTKTHPWRGMSLYNGSQCTFLPLSSNI